MLLKTTFRFQIVMSWKYMTFKFVEKQVCVFSYSRAQYPEIYHVHVFLKNKMVGFYSHSNSLFYALHTIIACILVLNIYKHIYRERIMYEFLSRMKRFGNDFHDWRSHKWKSYVKFIAVLPNEKNIIVIHGNEFIVLALERYLISRKHKSAKNYRQ